jgi:hypothetical protein
LRHLFADSVYNGANLRDALGNWATGRSRLSNAPPMPPALKFCHANAGRTRGQADEGLAAFRVK